MTNQQLAQSVWSRLGGKVDWAPVPLILAKASEAIKMVTKQLVFNNNPLAELLIKPQTLAYTAAVGETIAVPLTIDGNKYFTLSDSIVRSQNRLHAVYYIYGSDKIRMEPTNSWTSLTKLPNAHNKPYYKLEGKKIYTKIPTFNTGTNPVVVNTDENTNYGLYIEHYQYLPVSEFPFELIDVLLDALIPMLATSQPGVAQAPQPNAQ